MIQNIYYADEMKWSSMKYGEIANLLWYIESQGFGLMKLMHVNTNQIIKCDL